MVAHLLFAIHSFSILAFWLFLSVTLATACTFSGDKLSRKNSDDTSGQMNFNGYNGNKTLKRGQKSKDLSLEQKCYKVERSERLSLHGEDVNMSSIDHSLPCATPKVPPTDTTQQHTTENHPTQRIKSLNLVSCADSPTQKDPNTQNTKATKNTEKLTTTTTTKTHERKSNEHVPVSKERIAVGSKDILMASQERPKIEKPKRQHTLTTAKPSTENSKRQKESVNQLRTATQDSSPKQDVFNKHESKKKRSSVEATQQTTGQLSADTSKETTKTRNNTSKTEKEATTSSTTHTKTNNSIRSKKAREPHSEQFTQEITQTTQDAL